MNIRKRAMSDKQKTERRQAILDAAETLFQSTLYNTISMNAVAEQANIVKGTLYLYFKTKEGLFLALYVQTIERWFEELEHELQTMAARQDTCEIAEFVAAVGETILHYPTLTRLMVISHTILERNIDEATALAFKQMLYSRLSRLGPLSEVCLPFLETGQGAHLFIQLYALVIGFQSLSDPAPIVKQLIVKSELKMFQVDFADEFLATLTALLEGIRYQNRRR